MKIKKAKLPRPITNSFGLIVVIFGIAYFYARKKGAVEEAEEDEATSLLERYERS